MIRGEVANSAFYKQVRNASGGFYYVGFHDTEPFHKKGKDAWCWASCVQHLMYFASHHPHDMTQQFFNQRLDLIPQSELVERFYKMKGADFKARYPNYPDAASAFDIANLIGLYQVSVTSGGSSTTLLESLAAGFPAILCYHPADSATGHAVIVTGAYFRFVKQNILSSLVFTDSYAFYRLEILDPDTGKPDTVDAATLEGTITGVVAFGFAQCVYPNVR